MKRICLCMFLFLNLQLNILQAQHSLYVKEKNGTQNEYSIDEIRKLEFNEEIMTVSKTDGSSTRYTLIDIGYLSFTDYDPGIINLAEQKENSAVLFPNPVEDQLYFVWSSLAGTNVHMEILDMMGRTVFAIKIDDIAETDRQSVCVSQLQQGLYLFRISDGRTIQAMKFFKK